MVELVELDDSTIKRMDDFAAEHILGVFDEPERFADPAWHNPALDQEWATRERWISCAERSLLDKPYVDPDAAKILLDL